MFPFVEVGRCTESIGLGTYTISNAKEVIKIDTRATRDISYDWNSSSTSASLVISPSRTGREKDVWDILIHYPCSLGVSLFARSIFVCPEYPCLLGVFLFSRSILVCSEYPCFLGVSLFARRRTSNPRAKNCGLWIVLPQAKVELKKFQLRSARGTSRWTLA